MGKNPLPDLQALRAANKLKCLQGYEGSWLKSVKCMHDKGMRVVVDLSDKDNYAFMEKTARKWVDFFVWLV